VNITPKKIIALYRSGESAPRIADTAKIGLHTVYRALKKGQVQRRTQSEQNAIRFLQSAKSYQTIRNLTAKEQRLKIAALMLYWGEGAKTGNTVDLANSSLPALKLFLKFLREICQVKENKLRFYLYCFKENNPAQLISYWSQALKVNKSQFTKPYIRETRTEQMSRVMPHGVLHIRYSDKKLLTEILANSETILNELTAM
jgi:hypothetical protein